MPTAAEMFPTRYLKAADIKKPVVVKIERAPVEKLKNPRTGEESTKVVLYFTGAKKCLPLNKVNFESVANVCGENSDSWPGHRIEVYPDRTTMAGKTVDCVRIRKPGETVVEKPEDTVPAADADMDDEIPL
jgi:hypothetical protein